MKKIIGWIMLLSIILSTPAFGKLERVEIDPRGGYDGPYERDYQYNNDGYYDGGLYDPFYVELNANDDSLEARIGKELTRGPNAMSIGINGSFSDDEYTLISGDLSFGNRLFDEDRFLLSMGFRGIGGTVETIHPDKNSNEDADVGAISFLISAILAIPNVGFDIIGEVATGPDPMCFKDTESYLDARIALGINILDYRRGTVLLGFRALQIEFDKALYEKNELSEESFFFGYRLRF